MGSFQVSSSMLKRVNSTLYMFLCLEEGPSLPLLVSVKVVSLSLTLVFSSLKGSLKSFTLSPSLKIITKMGTWKGKLLSIMGRVQLVNAIISSMLVFSFHVYKWPASLLSSLVKHIQNFIWSGDVSQRKICTVAWKDMCRPYKEGGLSVKDPGLVNKSSLLYLCWQLPTSNEQWARLCRVRFLKQGKAKMYHIRSSIWPGLKHLVSIIQQKATWRVGNGENILFWTDNWIDIPIVDHWQLPESMHKHLTMTVFDYIVDGVWSLPEYFIQKDATLTEKILQIPIPKGHLPDTFNWNDSG